MSPLKDIEQIRDENDRVLNLAMSPLRFIYQLMAALGLVGMAVGYFFISQVGWIVDLGLPQTRPDAMGRMTLLAWSATIALQNRVDKGYRRSQPGALPLWLFPIRRHRVGQSPAHLPPMNSQLPCHCTDRSGAMFVLTPDLLV